MTSKFGPFGIDERGNKTYDGKLATCVNCRYHSIEMVSEKIEVEPDKSGLGLFDEDVKWYDDKEPFYNCKKTNKEVGRTPIYCESWEPVKKADTSEVDKMMARFAARHKDG